MDLLLDIIKITKAQNTSIDTKNKKLKVKLYDIQIVGLEVKKNKIICNNENYTSQHITRILQKKDLLKITEDSALDIINLFETNIYSYCTICSSSISVSKIGSCETCMSVFLELVSDDTITEAYKKDHLVVQFLIMSAYACLKHDKRTLVFKPFPPNFESFDELTKNIEYSFENYKELFEILSTCTNDMELYSKIDGKDYSFLKFIIISNNTQMLSDVTLFKNVKNIFSQKIKNIFDQKGLISFMIKHDPEKEKKFETNKPLYLFHGSSLPNWYNILRNGLKNMSRTQLMINGAACGSGIYLSDTLDVSFGYGSDRHSGSGLSVIGVAQIKGNYTTNRIVVIPNEDDVLLRYIIICKNQDNLRLITEYFINERPKELEKDSIEIDGIRKKRISYDYEQIKKYKIKASLLDNFDILVENSNLQLEIRYPKDYPMEAPSIMIIKSIKKLNHKDNCLIIDELINWKSNTRVDKIVKNIFS